MNTRQLFGAVLALALAWAVLVPKTDAQTTPVRTTGSVNHGATDTGAPVATGNRAVAMRTTPTPVAAGRRTAAYADTGGVPFAVGGHYDAIPAEAQIEDADGAQTNLALVTCAAGCKVVVTSASVTCSKTVTVDVTAVLGYGATVLPTRAHTGVAGILIALDEAGPGGGHQKGNGGGNLGSSLDGEDLRLTIEDPVGGACSVQYTYYTVVS